jgi:molecular chaperone Hsp33
MPGASQKEVKNLEKNINAIQSLATKISENPDPVTLLGQIFSDMTFVILDQRPLVFECNCSKDRIVRAFKLLGENEVQAMIDEDKGAKVTCDFCGKKYNFIESELRNVVEELKTRH